MNWRKHEDGMHGVMLMIRSRAGEIDREPSWMRITMSRNDFIKSIDMLCDSGQFDLAIEALSRRIESVPKDAKFWARRGWCKFSKGDFEGAISDFTSALEIKPGGATTLFFRARCWEELGRLAEANRDYSDSLSIRPRADVYIARGLIHKYSDRLASAKADFQEAMRLEPGNEIAAGLLAGLSSPDK